jgi:hypothetical protein
MIATSLGLARAKGVEAPSLGVMKFNERALFLLLAVLGGG